MTKNVVFVGFFKLFFWKRLAMLAIVFYEIYQIPLSYVLQSFMYSYVFCMCIYGVCSIIVLMF